MAKTKVDVPAPEPRAEEWVCAGDRLGNNDAVLQTWHSITPDGVLGTMHAFKPLPRIAVGGVYRVHVDGAGTGVSLYTKGTYAPVYLRKWKHASDIAEWLAHDETTHTIKSAQSKGLKALDRTEAWKALEPFAQVMAAQPGRHARAATLAAVIVYLENRAAEISGDAYLARLARALTEEGNEVKVPRMRKGRQP